MKKQINESNEGRILITLTPNQKSIQIDLDEIGCEFLIEELTNLLQKTKNIIDYDANTGYACGLMTKNSLGIIITRRDF